MSFSSQHRRFIELCEKDVLEWEHRYKVSKYERKKANRKLQQQNRVQSIFQDCAQLIQQKAHLRISAVVSKCLSIVFDEPYSFHILFEQKRGKTEARLVFKRGEMEIDPLFASGGGVIDIASFALRISCMMLKTPEVRKLIIMDEPFKFVSEQYQDYVRDMLQQLSDELGIQFIMITHIEKIKTGKVVQI